MTGLDVAEDEANPLDQQRELMGLLSQETRHQITQIVLGHPSHLPSADELDYIIADKTKKSITDQLDRLREEGIIDEYAAESNRSTRGLPGSSMAQPNAGSRFSLSSTISKGFRWLGPLSRRRGQQRRSTGTWKLLAHRFPLQSETPSVSMRKMATVKSGHFSNQLTVQSSGLDTCL